MSYFAVDPAKQRDDAARALDVAVGMLEASVEIYDAEQNEDNLKAMMDAGRLVEETKCQVEEWVL